MTGCTERFILWPPTGSYSDRAKSQPIMGLGQRLPQLAAKHAIPGLLEMRQEALIARDRDALARRMRRYFDPEAAMSVLQDENCGPVRDMARFDAAKARSNLLKAEHFDEANVRSYYQRPFETSWCYYTSTLRWTPSVGQEFGRLKRESGCVSDVPLDPRGC